MNAAFKYYGKQPETNLAKQALIVQSKYNLNDMQLSGLLEINDFFQRIVLLDVHVSKVRVDGERLPHKTVEFFKKFDKCSDVKHFFTPITAKKSFTNFADNILSNITKLSDYVAVGLLSVAEDVEPTIFEYQGGAK